MNLREVIKNLSDEVKEELIKNINLCSYANHFAQDDDGCIFVYRDQPKFYVCDWDSYSDYACVNTFPLATDHATTILTRDEVLELLKVEEYTLDNLPKKWFVEMSDDVDRELLAKKLNCESIGGLYHYYGISKYRKWSNSAECFDDCVDVTHLFKKKEEKMETIEINGKKYRKIDTKGNFKNGDIVHRKDLTLTGRFIGYDQGVPVYCYGDDYFREYRTDKLYKLEEIKTKTYYYAFYKLGIDVHITKLYLSESKIREDIDNILEIRTFEQEL